MDEPYEDPRDPDRGDTAPPKLPDDPPGLPFEIPEALLHQLGEGVTLANREGRIVFSNRAADRILGVEATDAPPEEWVEHYGVFREDGETPFPTEEYPLVRALDGESTTGVEMLIRNPGVPDGALISVTGNPVRDPRGEIVGAAVVFTDVTDLRRIQGELEAVNQELLRTQRLKDELTTLIVHDLKSPLTGILLSAEMLLDASPEDAAEASPLRDIRESAATLHDMVMDLLDVDLAEEGRLDLEPVSVPVYEALETEARALRARAAASDRTIVVDDGARGHTVQADPGYLRRVIRNLADNCLKYAPARGTITLGSRPGVGPRVVITVADEGPGVPAEHRETIFDRYARVERDGEGRHQDSRGLGLRFCRLAVEAHGGRLWVEDNAPKGARFCVELEGSPGG